jgi:hypothetical protein
VDGAGFSHQLTEWIAAAGAAPTFRWEYSTGWSFTAREQAAVETCDRLGQVATDADGQVRTDAFVAEVTGLLGDLTGWPKHHRVLARKEPLHPCEGRLAVGDQQGHALPGLCHQQPPRPGRVPRRPAPQARPGRGSATKKRPGGAFCPPGTSRSTPPKGQ